MCRIYQNSLRKQVTSHTDPMRYLMQPRYAELEVNLRIVKNIFKGPEMGVIHDDDGEGRGRRGGEAGGEE